ncbi:hypothetical protein BJV77DRAFT_148389 [Russula vinacea]|nr:hypothetical protein BJV77DRAFT_148389 [Russula vinacea]
MSQHSPAMRVGGRRLSLPSRARPNTQVDEAVTASPGEPADYPRPSAPGTEQAVEHARNDEERRQRRSAAGVTARMRMSVACVRTHSAGQTRIGSIESWAVRPGSMRASPNQDARLLSEA